jgi:O-antigen/teichoic acid export membrane protein
VVLRDADMATVKELMRLGAPLGAAGALNMALFRIDAVLLQALKGPFAVGMYGIAYRFLDSFLFVAYGVGQVVMPRIAKQGAAGDAGEATRSFGLVLGVVLAFYLPIAVGSLFTARYVVELLFSSRYAEAGDAVKWLTGAGVFYAVAYLARVTVVALGRRRQIAVIAGVVLVANIVGNLVAIPRWGFNGAAAVTFFSEVVEAGALLVVFLGTTQGHRFGRFVAVPLTASAVMAAALWASGADGAAALGVGALSYAVALPLAAMVLARDETARVAKALRQRGG